MTKPNILFLMTDQQRWDAMGCATDWMRTPTLDRIAAETGFSGVVIVEQQDERLAEVTMGYADRARKVAVELDTRFATASATKGFTALAVAALIESGRLRLETPFVEHAYIEPEAGFAQVHAQTGES